MYSRREKVLILIGFLGPAVLVLLVIGIYPLAYAFWNSLHQFVLPRVARDGTPWVGLDNYISVLTDDSFQQALARTFGFLGTVLPFQVVFGLGIALLLHQPGASLLRVLTRLSLVIPMATTYAVVGLIGRLLFNGNFGVVNQLIGLFGFRPVDWLANPTLAFAAVAAMDVWQWTPFCALVFLAGLTMVPVEVEEAARLETEKWWAVLRYVQLPFLIPGITAILILRTADILKMFDAVFTMTRGGPGAATELISVYIQRIGFRVFDQGVASAQAVILLVLTIILSRLYIRVIYREIQ